MSPCGGCNPPARREVVASRPAGSGPGTYALDPTRTCGNGTWGHHSGTGGCHLLGTTAGGVQVYLPYRFLRDGAVETQAGAATQSPGSDQDIRYGLPMHDQRVSVIEQVSRDEIVVHGPAGATVVVVKDDVLTIFGSSGRSVQRPERGLAADRSRTGVGHTLGC